MCLPDTVYRSTLLSAYICVMAAASGTEHSGEVAASDHVVDPLFIHGPWILVSCMTKPKCIILGGLQSM